MKQVPSYNVFVFRDVLISIIREELSPLEPISTDLRPTLTPMTGIRACLFDIYGTLFISASGDISQASDTDGDKPWRAMAAAEALIKSGFLLSGDKTPERVFELYLEEILREHNMRRLAGIDVPEVDIRRIWERVIDRLKEEGRLKGTADEASFSIVALRYELSTNKIWPMPGALDLFDILTRRTMPMGLVSNAQFYTPLSFKALFGSDETDLGFASELLFYSYEHHVAKPSANMFRPVLERLETVYHIRPEEVVYVGNDIRNDILAASQCGCKTILFAGDKRSLRLRREVPECRTIRPDAVVTQLMQIPLMFDEGAST
ncbi:HAD family hydrolase [Sediminispirochaeta smaragdinae]|uniref:Haloacid dehalogenase domain protein hydrolase n=1 Tax=Sediminispirochaeta smaragdinae (strain DSM 11293 / JCM 15392 / SEBR 4228) TaxID=573413 RepID=E1R1C9_SEDSS|nr:HAD family hydrolase [Sediminispirochaeta smaragdinae]ADK81070.1 Haloacid dehalogenase domain protein hydrolase [Sediminispirochaeta smaragdinae DSM 11293]